jgi:hypothetical protein
MGWTVARMLNEGFILIFRSETYCRMATWKTIKGIILRLFLRMANGWYWLSGRIW